MRTSQTLRLNLDSRDVSTLLQHPLLSSAPKRRRIHQTHFDTSDQALARSGLSVNETRILRKTMLTVQRTGNDAHLWTGSTTPGAFDFATLIDDPETAERLTQFAGNLIPIYTIEARQREWSIQIRSAQVDVILEEGTLSAGEDSAQRTKHFCEIELRLYNGQLAALYGLGRLLSRQVRLHPVADNLAQQAHSLSFAKSPGPAKAKRVKIDAKECVIGVFKQIAWLCLRQLQENEEGVFTPSNVEFIHQARVALRRLRTALRLFEAELPPGFSDKWGQAWRDVGEQLGNARNWDVFYSETLPAMAGDLGNHAEFIQLKEFALIERKKAHTETQQWLRGRRYSLTMVAFCEALLMLPDRKTDRIDAFADKAIKKRYKRFCRGARIAHTLNGEQRHEVRIDLKKLRYTLDFFESLYPQKQLHPFLSALAETQELLGHMNDLVSGEALLASRPGNPFDLPVAWTKGRMSAYLETLPAALKPVLDAKTPW